MKDVFFKQCFYVTDKRKSKNQKVSESGRGKRYSYKLPQEYNIETVVVADPAMVLYHGKDAARRFILTILNMVRNLKFILAFATSTCVMNWFHCSFLLSWQTTCKETVSTWPLAGCQDLTRIFCNIKPWCCTSVCTIWSYNFSDETRKWDLTKVIFWLEDYDIIGKLGYCMIYYDLCLLCICNFVI